MDYFLQNGIALPEKVISLIYSISVDRYWITNDYAKVNAYDRAV